MSPIPNYARKTTGHHTTVNTTAPTGSESSLPAWTRCRFCERPLVPDSTTGADAAFVWTTTSGPSCPSCDRNPLTGVFNP